MGHPSTNYTTTSNDKITQSVLSAFPFGGATRTTPQVQTPTREVSTVSNDDSGYSSDEEDVYSDPSPAYHEPSTDDNVNKKRKTTTTTSIFGRLTSFLPTTAAIVSDSDGDGDGDGDDDNNGNSDYYYLYDHRPVKRIRHDDFFASSSSSSSSTTPHPTMKLPSR